MKKFIRRFLKTTGIILLLLIAAVFLIPILFKKQITALVKKEINKNLVAKVDFKDASLSVFKHFPRVTISLTDLSVVGLDEFIGDTLLSVQKIDAAAGLMSIIKGKDIKVSGLYLESPRIHALVNKNGKTNWDIARPSGDTTNNTDTSASEFKMSLKKYEIHNGYILYRDESANISTEFEGVDHEGSGDLTAEVFTLSTETHAASASITQDNIPYLFNTKTDITADIKIDNKTSTYTFKTDDIKLNNLILAADGFFQLANDSTYKMDINFKSPSNDFKDILSLIPAIYKKDFDKIKTSGSAVFNGFVKGTYSPQQLPAYDVNVAVKDGSFQYAGQPKPISNIQLALHAVNTDGLPDNAVIDLSKGHLEMNNEPFDFHFIFKNPVTAQYIDAVAKGKIDLSQLSQFIKLEDGTKLAGIVAADAFAKGNMSALQHQSGPFSAGGFFNIQNLFYSAKNFPQPIQNGNISATLENNGGIADNTTVNVTSGHIEVGRDPVDFILKLTHPVSSIDFDGHAKGSFTLDNIKQFVSLEPGTSISGQLLADLGFAGNKTAIDKKEYDKIALSGTAGVQRLKFASADYPTGINIASTQLGFNGKNVTLDKLTGDYLHTHFNGTGSLNNLVGYAMSNQELGGSLDVVADKINLNDWMGSDTAGSVGTGNTTPSSAFLVPAGINFTVHAIADQVKYDKVDYNHINGSMVLNDQKITLQNVKAEALDGTIAISGSYSTKLNKTKPDIGLTYDVKDVDVQKAFASYNTIQALMPIGRFLAGKLSSQLSMTGNLNGKMLPDLASLSGKGNLLLLQGVLAKFAPLEKLAAVLQIDRLKSISLKDIKNYIEFANGRVLVKPFTIKIQDIEMEIGGLHGFDQSIDYSIQMKVPRSLLGTQGNNLINGLASQAISKGIPIKLGETVNLSVKMLGSITNPSIKVDLKEIAGDVIKELEEKAKDFVQAKLDSAKQKVKDSLNSVRAQVTESIKDKLKEQIFGKDTTSVQKAPADSSQNKPTDKMKKTLKDLFSKPKKPVDTTKH